MTTVLFLAVSLLRDLKHANIVTLHDIIHTDKSLTLVFEYLVSNVHYFLLCSSYVASALNAYGNAESVERKTPDPNALC